MKFILRTSLGCLFIALALNAAFTHAQSLWLAPYPAVPISPPSSSTWSHQIDHLSKSLPWLKMVVHYKPGQSFAEAGNVAIITLIEPTVTRKGCCEWVITFKKP